MSVAHVACLVGKNLKTLLRLVIESHKYGQKERERSLDLFVLGKGIISRMSQRGTSAKSLYLYDIIYGKGRAHSKKEAEQMGVHFMPMEIRFGREEFFDGVDLYPENFYEKLIENDALPQTSQINPFRWEEEFEKLTADGSEVIVITISSRLSGTYTSACIAAEKFQNKVYVIDSMSVSIGERHLLTYALQLIERGLSVQEIILILFVPLSKGM